MIREKEPKQTHAERIREVHADQLKAVCSLLSISPEQYCWHQYRQYEKFLELACPQHPEFRQQARHSEVFRAFWNNEWANRNYLDFLPFAYDVKYDNAEILAEYKHIHSAERLFTDDAFFYRFESMVRFIK